jgi:hypothetical protein
VVVEITTDDYRSVGILLDDVPRNFCHSHGPLSLSGSVTLRVGDSSSEPGHTCYRVVTESSRDTSRVPSWAGVGCCISKHSSIHHCVGAWSGRTRTHLERVGLVAWSHWDRLFKVCCVSGDHIQSSAWTLSSNLGH